MRAALLLALTFLVPTPANSQGRTFDPLFDYTHLRPADEERWKELTAGEVTLFAALDIALNASKGHFFALSARLEGGANPRWRIESIEADDAGQPHRVDIEVGIHEPKVARRVELLTLAQNEVVQWKHLKQRSTSLWLAIQLGVDLLNQNPNEITRVEGRADNAVFNPEPKNPHWEFEIWCWDKASEIPRRYETHVNAIMDQVQRQILLDRYPGTPLRKATAEEREDGLIVHDFIVGDGPLVEADSRVRVNYRLFLLDNTKLHDTWEKKRPEDFLVSKAPFKGLTMGMPGMRVGGKRKIVMPYRFAFGETGNDVAPPRAMVVCDMMVEALAR